METTRLLKGKAPKTEIQAETLAVLEKILDRTEKILDRLPQSKGDDERIKAYLRHERHPETFEDEGGGETI